MKPNGSLKIVLLALFATFLVACVDRSHSRPLMEEAAQIAQEAATKMGYTPANQLIEIDQCAAPPCFYTIYFTTTDDVASFATRLKANGLVDPDPYEVAQETELFTELGASTPGQYTGKFYLPEFEAASNDFLSVNGEQPWLNPYGYAPLHSTMWQFQRRMAADSDGNINFKLYEVSKVADQYTFGDRPIVDNVVAISVQHGRTQLQPSTPGGIQTPDT